MACLAEQFPADSEFGVFFTSSLPVAPALIDWPQLTVSTLGGRIPWSHAGRGGHLGDSGAA